MSLNSSTFVWPAAADLSCQARTTVVFLPWVGPTIWNSLGNNLCDPDLGLWFPAEDASVLAVLSTSSAVEALYDNVLCILTFLIH